MKEYTRDEAEAIVQVLKAGLVEGNGKSLTLEQVQKAAEVLKEPRPDKIIVSPYLDKN